MKKVVKKVKATLKEGTVYSTPEMKHYLGALNEMHGETLKGIRENFVLVNKKLDLHSEMIGVLMEDVSDLKIDVSELKTDVSVLKTDVYTLKSDMKIVKEDLSSIKGDLKKKVDYDDFLSLVKRVQKLEAKS